MYTHTNLHCRCHIEVHNNIYDNKNIYYNNISNIILYTHKEICVAGVI